MHFPLFLLSVRPNPCVYYPSQDLRCTVASCGFKNDIAKHCSLLCDQTYYVYPSPSDCRLHGDYIWPNFGIF